MTRSYRSIDAAAARVQRVRAFAYWARKSIVSTRGLVIRRPARPPQLGGATAVMRTARRLATDHEALRDSALRRARRVKDDLEQTLARGRRNGGLGEVGTKLAQSDAHLVSRYVAIARHHHWQALRIRWLLEHRSRELA